MEQAHLNQRKTEAEDSSAWHAVPHPRAEDQAHYQQHDPMPVATVMHGMPAVLQKPTQGLILVLQLTPTLWFEVFLHHEGNHTTLQNIPTATARVNYVLQ